MPGPILFVQLQDGKKEPLVMVPGLDSYGCKMQLDAMEAQANANDQMLVVSAMLQDWPKADDAEEGDKADA